MTTRSMVANFSVGRLVLSEYDGCITHCWFAENQTTDSGSTIPSASASMASAKASPVLREAVSQLEEYFAGRRTVFDLPLAPLGTAFQQKVWRILQTINYGETWSYQQLAKQVGNANASRAVGSANGKNPIGIIIPCHRVIRASGQLGGYAGGLDLKAKLLMLEQQGQAICSKTAT